MRLDKFLWFVEAEGLNDLVDTYDARMNAVINDFISCYFEGENINNNHLQREIGIKHGFSNGFTEREKNYIVKQVEKRISL